MKLMIAKIKNQNLTLPVHGVIVTTVIRIVLPFYSGYSGNGFGLVVLCTEPIRYLLLLLCGIIISSSAVAGTKKLLRFLALTLLFSFGLVHIENFTTLGIVLSIHNANPTQIRDDARNLMDELDRPTHFTNYVQQRVLVGEFVPKERLPQSLQSERFNDILVMDDKVFLEKQGLCCLFRGFIVFKEGSDIWKAEEPFKLLDGCNHCWRIRIIEGLYWYHDVPSKEETSTIFNPLK
jgi:hypothetical protein